MTGKEVLTMAETFTRLGVKKIRLTGGEPLVRKDAHQIIRNLGHLDAELAITTNAVLVDQYIDTFKEAGIRSVNVSLDSLQAERQAKISRRDYFERIIRNIFLLMDEGLKVKINMVVMKNINDDELIDFVELTKDNSLQVRFIEFMPFQGNRWNWANGIGLNDMMATFNNFYGRILKKQEQPNETARCYQVPGYKGSFGIISSVTQAFCSTCNRIRVTADGKMRNCLFADRETDLLTPLRTGEDITPLIVKTIQTKKATRAGLNTMADLNDPSRHEQNRSMVAIGG